MKNSEIITLISEQTGMDTTLTETMLNAAAEVFTKALTDGSSIGIQGFGIFEPQQKSERISVHPKTGVRSMIPPKIVVNFRQSNTLKEKIKANRHEK